ncbi:uncharacterized protein NECHADRAFT_42497 [Fusarium vanettenii 77-13-4]|uniref:Prion-inhibition and propagation HeLo domain-containing protein n=1 Tax=Fusarium vanettenii (strain ATCC MYA-4622 / CBS 123669 / FGSC 9596 / NRRL 45880 / 77-13-4) TaxID=660122 RepID=C7ZHT0_FUSV7|nr:uncharacterized protein NECHADRAFT_42497 [Fusarium vanettenii 77-13-4]EEU36566.1 hypothetical protein NECHADRAFT_42497 [Fusarium vanettenii 77-13-4]
MSGPEVIGAVAGVAGLFTTAIEWFDYIYVAKNAGRQLESLLLKLDNAQLRLTRWGTAVGLNDSESPSLDEEYQQHAEATFKFIIDAFSECQRLCHEDRKELNKTEDDEIKPFGSDWSLMNRYLHDKMQRIVRGRKNGMSTLQKAKFAVYKKDRLVKLIKDINDHLDQLYRDAPIEDEEQTRLGKAELDELIHVLKALQTASGSDKLLEGALQSILNQKAGL